MKNSVFRFTLNHHIHRSQVSVPVFLGDTAVQLYISLTDGGNTYYIEDGCTAVLRGKKPDGKTLLEYCIIENNTRIRYDFNEQTTSCEGIVNCEISLYGADGNLLTCPKFIIVVGDRVVDDTELIESESERSALDAIFASEAERKDAEKARADAETARAEAEKKRADSWAKISCDIVVEKGSGEGSVQQAQDQEANVTEGYFDFTDKNPNATKIDPSLTGEIQYGATGEFASTFNGRSAAQGFRAFSEGEDTIAKGEFSHAEGKKSVAIGKYAHAEGKQSVASAPAAHAEGTLTIASSDQAHAEGYYSKANGKHSHAEGHATTAEGEDSHAEGINTKATAVAAHAEGQGTVAEGVDSHAEGYKTQATGKDAHAEGNQTVALGEVSHAEGTKTEANGKHSHAEGYYTKSTGENSHAEGWATKANGENSHAEGLTTEANGKASHSGGIGTKAQGEAQTVLGTYNIPDEESLLIVGCGISNTQRRNILRVTHDAVYVTKPDGTEVDILSVLLNLL